MRADDA
jgi:hypothetical protein